MDRYRNRTRTASSIPAKLRSEGKLHLVPVYHVLRLSDLAREGIQNSGSYRFADHIYAGRPSGRLGIGRLLDAMLLGLPSARALRERYVQAKIAIAERAEAAASAGRNVRILAVPCGLGRELFEAHDELRGAARGSLQGYGLDLDDQLVAGLRERVDREGRPFEFLHGDAFDPAAFPAGRFDLIISTGFTEFLDDDETVRHYAILREKLAPGGTLFASAMRRHGLSDFLLRNLADLHTNYRDADDLRALCRAAGYGSIRHRRFGLQTIVYAEGAA
jgi:hypothetical protein